MQRIGEVLLAAGLISETQLTAALGEQARWGNRLGETLVQLGFLAERDLIRVLSERFGHQGIDLAGRQIHPDVVATLPAEIASKYGCLPVARERRATSDDLYLAMEDPSNLVAVDDVSFRTGCTVHPLLAGPVQLRMAIAACYESGPLEGPARLEFASEPAAEPDRAFGAEALSQERWLDDIVEQLDGPGRASDGAREGDAGRVPTRKILQALTRLLIAKGVLTREELMAEVKRLAD